MVVGRRSGRGLAELELHYSRHVREGKWWTPVRRPAHLMKILSLFDLADALDEAGERWRQTAVDVTYRFVHEVPEAGDMGYPYSPSHGAVLVDVLAMVPPVLARCGAVVGDGTLVGAAGRHLLTFANTNVDRETGLPFHGFYPNGPRYLGMLGWGRGVGWYLLGFALTIPSMPIGPTRTALVEAFEAGVKAAMRFQRDDGMWSDALLHARGASADSSATALIGWAIATGVRGGFLGDWARQSVLRARTAMKARTDRWGRVTGASGECGGLGRYSGVVGHFPWGQGPALAFAASETP